MGFPLLVKHEARVYALMRIVIGFLFLCHGLQKVVGMFGGAEQAPPFIRWAAGSIELLGGLLVMLGLQAGIAAFVSSGTMAVAYFMAHQPGGALPIQNGGELAAAYAFVFLFIAARGSGSWSVDAMMKGRPAG